MADKKIIYKNVRLWYENWKIKKVGEKNSNGKYWFVEMPWTNGVVIDEIVNNNNIMAASDGTYADLSVTKTSDIQEWNRRKIIRDITIKVEKNTDKYSEAVNYSLFQVKKSLFDLQQVRNYRGSFITDRIYDGRNQIVLEPNKINFFNNSVELTNLNYELPEDEDFALVQDITFKGLNFAISKGDGRKYGESVKPFIDYEITIIYSNMY